MSVYIPADLKRRIRAHFADCCAYCRTAERLSTVTFEIEHIMPSSANGETVFENLCLSCPTCNRYKSNLMLAIDPETQTEAPLFHPQLQRWTDHFEWVDDGTRIVGLTTTGRATVSVLKMNRPQMLWIRRLWVAVNEHPPDLD